MFSLSLGWNRSCLLNLVWPKFRKSEMRFQPLLCLYESSCATSFDGIFLLFFVNVLPGPKYFSNSYNLVRFSKGLVTSLVFVHWHNKIMSHWFYLWIAIQTHGLLVKITLRSFPEKSICNSFHGSVVTGRIVFSVVLTNHLHAVKVLRLISMFRCSVVNQNMLHSTNSFLELV